MILGERINRGSPRFGGHGDRIALGGSAFLPNKAFNLNGNVGYYQKAWAAALNIAALISPNFAFNAGVGYGFNRGGTFGARAGITLGGVVRLRHLRHLLHRRRHRLRPRRKPVRTAR